MYLLLDKTLMFSNEKSTLTDMKFCQVEKQCSVTLIQLRNNRKNY